MGSLVRVHMVARDTLAFRDIALPLCLAPTDANVNAARLNIRIFFIIKSIKC